MEKIKFFTIACDRESSKKSPFLLISKAIYQTVVIESMFSGSTMGSSSVESTLSINAFAY